MADTLMVNSKFTASTFKQTFQSLTAVPDVLYPSLNFSAFDVQPDMSTISDVVPHTAQVVFLSINRFERKKNLNLAIKAYSKLKEKLSNAKADSGAVQWKHVHLVMAGGYDNQNAENIEHFEELDAIVKEENLENSITFLRSFSDSQKVALLERCDCLLYTPSNEHFGIVPIEAMYCRRPVIAVNSGGPLETVAGETRKGEPQTGFLCDPDPEAFAEAMRRICSDKRAAEGFGRNGRERVNTRFSFEAFQTQLAAAVESLAKGKKDV